MNGDMTCRSGLPSQDHVLFQHGAASQPCLTANDIVFAHHAAMPDLDQAINLCAAFDVSLA